MKLKNRLKTPLKKAERKAGKPVAQLTLDQDKWLQGAVSGFLSDGSVHGAWVEGPWKLDALERDLGDYLLRSSATHRVPDLDKPGAKEDLEKHYVFGLTGDCFIYVHKNWLRVFSRIPKEAEDIAEGLKVCYRARPEKEDPCFFLIKQTSCGIESEEIALTETEAQTEEQLTLFYGSGFVKWHEAFLEKFSSRETGISIFEGPPGTGKTSYIRELMRLLKDSHQFYFLPSSNLEALKNPEFIDFWSGERRRALTKNLVVILEDAESALVPRNEDNRKQVSVLLNITDGILGEFLKLQIIATVNCGINEIDQALLRPGRLVARRHFGKLKEADARKLAEANGKSLAEGEAFSLADILGSEDGLEEGSAPQRRMGFEA